MNKQVISDQIERALVSLNTVNKSLLSTQDMFALINAMSVLEVTREYLEGKRDE